MEVSQASDDVPTPVFADRHVDDGTEHQRIDVVSCARGLRGLQRGGAQRKIVELEIKAETEVFAVIAGDTDGSNAASAAHEIRGVAVGETGSAAYVK